MHSDPILVERLSQLLEGRRLEKRTMFGGICFFLNGNMCVGVWHQDLIARVGEAQAAQSAEENKSARLMDLTGRPMRAWLQIEHAGYKKDTELNRWCDLAVDFVSGLPKKVSKK